jgi:hypothetical protein
MLWQPLVVRVQKGYQIGSGLGNATIPRDAHALVPLAYQPNLPVVLPQHDVPPPVGGTVVHDNHLKVRRSLIQDRI